jgi:tripartite-type tricarboxylate transporter receptor subunit TctC
MKKPIISVMLVAVGVLFYGHAAVQAAEQNYPKKMVQIIVPVAAGGNLDLVARSMAPALTKSLGQQFIVDNRPGASSLVGIQLVARAAPDGYTLLFTANTFALAPFVMRNAGYDPVKDFVGVSQACTLPQILVVRPTLPVKSVKELLAYARANPGKLNVGHSGTGGTGHMAWEMFNQAAGGDLKVVQIPYKGNAPALIDLLGGQLDMVFDTFSTSIQYVKAGKIRALGLGASKRSPIFPDLPTVAEAGEMAGFDPSIFNGFLAPAGTSKDILGILQREVAKAVQQPEIRNRFLAQGVELIASDSPEQFTEFIRNQVERHAKIVRDAGIKPE